MRHLLCLLLGLFASSVTLAEESLCPALSKESQFSWKRTEGPDFDICRAISDKDGSELFGMYLGNHPSVKPAEALVAETSRIGKARVTWYITNPSSPNAIARETVVQLPSEKFPRFAHIWFSVTGAQEREQRLVQIGALNFGL